LSTTSFIKQNILLEQIPCDCTGGGFFGATRGVIGTPPLEIRMERVQEACDGRVRARWYYVLTGDTVQLFNRVRRQLQASAGYILSQMLNR
jgi:hypothetical protein